MLLEDLEPKLLDDFLPLARVSHKSLNQAKKIFQREREIISEKNRIYYLSKRLDVEPGSLTKSFRKPFYTDTTFSSGIKIRRHTHVCYKQGPFRNDRRELEFASAIRVGFDQHSKGFVGIQVPSCFN